ncbi:MAG: sulfotransferase [Acidimicrobiales bacterium]|nr:sulfotransferase [Acidimicrobiales bacterium]
MRRMERERVSVRDRARSVVDPVLWVVSPRHRRWRTILRSSDLAIDDLPKVLPAPGPDDILICGSPRSGTALVTAQLHQPPMSLGVMEPWDALRLPPRELFASVRSELEGGVLRRGRLDLDALERDHRVRWCRDGELPHPVEYRPDTVVAIKYPGFWRYLDRLPQTRFVVCLRDPVETIRSFRTTGGRLREGLQYDLPFEDQLNRQLRERYTWPVRRRVALYDTINEALLPHLDRPEVFVVRYERWFDDPDVLMAELAAFVGRDLGPGPARIASARSSGDTAEDAFIRRTCTTAAALGYR